MSWQSAGPRRRSRSLDMRLLSRSKDGDLVLTQDLVDPPPYGILSHRWTDDEVTLSDIQSKSYHQRKGLKKLEFCLAKAYDDGLDYIWADTCCIDKRSTSEVDKAIRSMYQYYARSTHCYVYLADVRGNVASSVWFLRGWTLQELLAPHSVKFYDMDSTLLGSRDSLSSQISSETGIDTEVLRQASLSKVDVATKFSWASHRTTTEPEDLAYCLMGLFDVTMPVMYGEGAADAFDRLKICISKKFEVELMRLNVFAACTVRLPHQVHKEPYNRRTCNIAQLAQQSRRHEIIKHLEFEEMESRRGLISEPLDSTCHWILEHEAFLAWQKHTETFLWIKGHPGAGKSTLMKFLDYRLGVERDSILISFYFNARGSKLEYSVAGAYRSLLVQLFRVGQLEEVLDRIMFGRKTVPDSRDFAQAPLPVLKEILVACFERLDRQVYCMVDALDETDEEDVLDMVDFLSRQRSPHLSICLASRHYPTLDLPINLQIVMDHHPGHQQDIKHYTHEKLHRRADDSIRDELIRKANGIFFWVVLVVGILNREYRIGCQSMAWQRLQQLPSRLVDLLQQIFGQGDTSRAIFKLCLQWLLYAERPLSLFELYYAVHMGAIDGMDGNVQKLTVNDMRSMRENLERFVVTHSKGLAEVGAHGRVQFIHQSVRDFLLGPQGVKYLCAGDAGSPDVNAHRRLAVCCLHAYSACVRIIDERGEESAWKTILDWPLRWYVVEYLAHHESEVEEAALEQRVQAATDSKWWQLMRWRPRGPIRDNNCL